MTATWSAAKVVTSTVARVRTYSFFVHKLIYMYTCVQPYTRKYISVKSFILAAL